MDMFVVHGGRRLSGAVRVSGAKNAALPMMAATLLADGPTTLHDVPELVDVRTMAQLLEALGVAVVRDSAPETPNEFPEEFPEKSAMRPQINFSDEASSDPSGESADIPAVRFPFGQSEEGNPAGSRCAAGNVRALRLEVVDDGPCVAPYDLVRKMRAGISVLGPLLARRGRACVSLPGGCAIGDRPVDLHLKGLRALGAEIHVERGYIIARARALRGARIYLGGPFGSTVTGTCNVMSAAVLAKGETTIEAAACEPEVVDLGNFLNAMGARIRGLGTPFLSIEGVESLSGTEHTIIPDRIEAATLLLAAAMTRGDLVIDNFCIEHMTAVVEKLRDIGVTIDASGRTVRATVRDELRAADCIMLPYPGLPTDVQAQFMALLTIVPGISVVTDKVFPDRFLHAAELARMGAIIRREGSSAIISGVPALSGAGVMASDLRASAALVLAALAAQGDTVIRRIYHLDRGYDRLEMKLNDLGAGIVRAADAPLNVPASLASDPSELLEPDPDHALKGPRWLKARERLRVHAPDEPG
jgi:UDP-N-acetylglucosamine 1-carboxyvinyltransferase